MKTQKGKPIPRIMPTSNGKNGKNKSKNKTSDLKTTFIKWKGKEIY